MNVYLKLSELKNNENFIDLRDSIRYLYPKKNTIMDGEFTKILFSKSSVTMNGIYIYLPLITERKVTTNSEIFIRTILNNSINSQIVEDLKLLENAILIHYKEYTRRSKQLESMLTKQLSTNQIRVYHDNNFTNKKRNFYVIKISGIWETDKKIGLTYKIMEL